MSPIHRLAVLIASALVAQGALGQRPLPFLHGGDVSEIPQVEETGGHYLLKGKVQDPFAIMKASGWNFVRFRVWNHPADGYCDEAHTLALAKRAKAAGLAISIDFHYSDYWADPGKQFKPAAWKDLSVPDLTKALYDFTHQVVADLVAQGTPPVMVQIGNEIRSGMLWPDGKTWPEDPKHWQNLAGFLKAGVQAVHDAQGDNHILTMIHLDTGGDHASSVWWFDKILTYGVQFDLIGLSYYPFWHGHLDALQANMNDLATRYGKDVYVAETAYPKTSTRSGHFEEVLKKLEPGYAADPKGQADFLRKVVEIIHQVPGGHGKGILYWAPMWISTSGHDVAWDTFATFDEQGNALPAVAALGERGRH